MTAKDAVNSKDKGSTKQKRKSKKSSEKKDTKKSKSSQVSKSSKSKVAKAVKVAKNKVDDENNRMASGRLSSRCSICQKLLTKKNIERHIRDVHNK